MADRERIAESIARQARLPLELVAAHIAAHPDGFFPTQLGWAARVARKASLPITRYAEPASIFLTGVAKSLRSRRAGPLPNAADLPLLREAARDRSARSRARCVLTHDVDWRRCYDSLPWLMALEAQHGLQATYHFLTEWRYRIAPSLLREMTAAGHEVGLHGRLHDAAIGWRSHRRMAHEIDRALAGLPEGIASYRAPALGFSLPLADVVVARGIKADSSMLIVNRYGECAQSVWPYEISPGLIELPLTIQDDLLFRDLKLSQRDAAAVVRDQLEAVLAAGGTFVFNGHPGILRAHPEFAQALLAMLRDCGAPVYTVSAAVAAGGH